MQGKWEETAHLKVKDHTGFVVHSQLFIVVDLTITRPTRLLTKISIDSIRNQNFATISKP